MSNLHLLPTPIPPSLPALELAKLLAHKLARVTLAPAFVVNDNGHPLLACGPDIGVYWTAEQVIFIAPVPE